MKGNTFSGCVSVDFHSNPMQIMNVPLIRLLSKVQAVYRNPRKKKHPPYTHSNETLHEECKHSTTFSVWLLFFFTPGFPYPVSGTCIHKAIEATRSGAT